MIVLKYWREILIALILAGVCFLGWHVKSVIDQNRAIAAQVKQQQADIANLTQQVKQVDDQRKQDNALTLAQINQRNSQQTERKKADVVFKQAVQANPVAKQWLDEGLPAAAVDRLREPAADSDGQADATTGTPR